MSKLPNLTLIFTADYLILMHRFFYKNYLPSLPLLFLLPQNLQRLPPNVHDILVLFLLSPRSQIPLLREIPIGRQYLIYYFKIAGIYSMVEMFSQRRLRVLLLLNCNKNLPKQGGTYRATADLEPKPTLTRGGLSMIHTLSKKKAV